MCGLVGIYRYKTRRAVRPDEIEGMSDLIAYRGPDGAGLHVDGDFGMGHRRLSIIDTSERASQPMYSEDRSWSIAYNGEVYNYLELQADLSAQGANFVTTSDTEVLLTALRHWGLDALPMLNGMYAFALWHQPTRTLTLARDRLGIKPLYYTIGQNGIAFASEIKCLLALPEHRVQPNQRLLDAYMGVGYCPGEETFFKGVYRLPPGHYLQVRDGIVTIAAYWNFALDDSEDLGADAYIDQARRLLSESVRVQLRSDVPVGVLLSGGVDSSAVVAVMRQQRSAPIHTFSVAWDYGPDYDEGRYAREVAGMFHTVHHEYRMTADDFTAFLPRYVWHMDEPVQEAAGIALYYLSALAREHVTVVLSGEGADEVFGGYPVYRYMLLLERYKALPKYIRNTLGLVLSRCGRSWAKHLALSQLALEQRYFGVSSHDMSRIRPLYTPATLEAIGGSSIAQLVAPYYGELNTCDPQMRMQYLDIKSWLVDDLLIKADRMSMAASLELRVPFLDHRFMQFAACMPSKYRIRGRETKSLFKQAMTSLLPQHIVYRRKQGFPTPIGRLLRGPLQIYLRSMLLSDRCHDRGLFRPEAVQQLIDDHAQGKADHHKTLWRLLILEIWHRLFVDGDPWTGLGTFGERSCSVDESRVPRGQISAIPA